MTKTEASSIALVTGGSRGIGLACARRLYDQGYEVHVTGRDQTRLEDVAARFGLVTHRVDATDEEAVGAMTAGLDISVLVANAGISSRGTFASTPVADVRHVLDVNVVGVFLAIRATLPAMLQRERGRIVAVSSIWGIAGNHNAVAYTASKHAVLGLVRAAAAEAAGSPVTCNAVCPTFTDTPLARRLVTEIAEEIGRPEESVWRGMLSPGPLKDPLDADEVAAAVAYLASDAARGINGHALTIDGGWFPR